MDPWSSEEEKQSGDIPLYPPHLVTLRSQRMHPSVSILLFSLSRGAIWEAEVMRWISLYAEGSFSHPPPLGDLRLRNLLCQCFVFRQRFHYFCTFCTLGTDMLKALDKWNWKRNQGNAAKHSRSQELWKSKSDSQVYLNGKCHRFADKQLGTTTVNSHKITFC